MKDFPAFGKTGTGRLVRKAPENESKAKLKLFVAWVVLFVVAMWFVQQRIDYIQTSKRVRVLKQQKRDLQNSILPLRLEERFLTSHGNIQNNVKKGIWLAKPEPEQIIYMTVQE